MIVITVAHHLEARFLIETLDLKKAPEISARPIFESDLVRVVISGTGAINTAIGTTLAFSTLSQSSRQYAALNFGICASSKAHAVGTLMQAHSIRSTATDRNFYPDQILDLEVPQASLESRQLPYLAAEAPAPAADLVDMEAAGFFEAARTFVSPSRIFVLKVVSDTGQSFEQIRHILPDLIQRQTNQLRSILRTIEEWISAQQEFLPEQQQAIGQIAERLRLTESQQQKLLFLCRARGKESDLITRLKPFLENHYTHRQQRTTLFAEIIDALSIPLL